MPLTSKAPGLTIAQLLELLRELPRDAAVFCYQNGNTVALQPGKVSLDEGRLVINAER